MLSQRLLVKSILLISILPGAALAQAGSSASLSLSVNSMTEGAVYRGWPLQVEIRAFLDEGESAQVQWPSGVHLAIRDAKGIAVILPLQMIASDEALVVVDADHSPGVLWILSAEASAALAPGDYMIQADHPAAGQSRMILITVSDEPGDLSREQLSLKTRLRARFEELTGTREAALQVLNDRLASVPDDIGVLGQKADLLGDMEQYSEALGAAQLAVRAFADQFKDATHPPFGLLRRVRLLQAKADAF